MCAAQHEAHSLHCIRQTKQQQKKSAQTKTSVPVKTLNIIRISPAYYCDPSYLDLVISTTWRRSTLGSGEALPNWLVYCDSFLWLGWHANLWVSNERWLRQSSRPSAFQLWYITFCPSLTHSKSVDQREGLGLRGLQAEEGRKSRAIRSDLTNHFFAAECEDCPVNTWAYSYEWVENSARWCKCSF